MINKKGLIIICVLGFIVINLFYIDAFYNNFMGDKLYNKKGFKESIKYFDSANNLQGVYNKGNSFYKLKKYSESIGEYKSILSNKKSDLNFRLNHNIANSFYRLGEEEKTASLKIKNWEEGVKYYSDALNIKYNEETKKNLEFVLEKIKKEKKKQDKKQDKNQEKKGKKKQDQNSQKNNKDNKKDGNSSKDSKDSKSTNRGDKKQGNNTDKNKNKEDQNNKKTSQDNKSGSQKKGDKSSLNKDNKNKQESNKSDNKQGKNTESKTNGSKKQGNNLTKDQEKALKQYGEALKQEQKKNSNDFNKVYKENTSKDPFNNFFNDPFFNNDLLNQGSGKKDW